MAVWRGASDRGVASIIPLVHVFLCSSVSCVSVLLRCSSMASPLPCCVGRYGRSWCPWRTLVLTPSTALRWPPRIQSSSPSASILHRVTHTTVIPQSPTVPTTTARNTPSLWKLWSMWPPSCCKMGCWDPKTVCSCRSGYEAWISPALIRSTFCSTMRLRRNIPNSSKWLLMEYEGWRHLYRGW